MTRTRQVLGLALLAAATGWAQAPKGAPTSTFVTVEQPDAQRTRDEFSALLDRYPPSLRGVLALDPNLLGNDTYLAPYPAITAFLNTHPEVARSPGYFVGEIPQQVFRRDREGQTMDFWREALGGVAIICAFGMGIGLVVWLIRTLVDYKRWSRLARVQTDAHTKLLDRFTANEDLLAYVQSPAGAKFLQSSPIALDAGPRGVGAPLGRILWSLQGGVVLVAGGIGLQIVSVRVDHPASQPLHAMGVLGIALGVGFVFSAIISYVISQRLGLIDTTPVPRVDLPAAR